ncbi:MAG: aminodeoxychorismate/anthranilate synthase component II [Desulfobacteraceae bacterium]|jgi:anthranilate synthase component 2|nr:MAG: aminodeoxychorismate/anthranilate synthase component II [Desulfobacteraceae bacterium]
MAGLLVIDNYDSFTHNLVQMFMCYDLEIHVHRCDRITLADIAASRPDYLVISPGPKDPSDAGISTRAVAEFAGKFPILGVCLGMQCINAAFGGKTVRAPVPVHGKTSRIHHDGVGVFAGMPSPFTAARYHSLMTADVPPDLRVTASSGDGLIMGIAHIRHPLFGVQFHPESFMTEHGFALIENFLRTGPYPIRKDILETLGEPQYQALESSSPSVSGLSA